MGTLIAERSLAIQGKIFFLSERGARVIVLFSRQSALFCSNDCSKKVTRNSQGRLEWVPLLQNGP